jgi:hypothetical protein
MDPMGEDLVHDNDVDPIITDRFECAYCGWHFRSRNNLFRHLRENGIDTRKLYRKRPRSYARQERKRAKVVNNLADFLADVQI